MAASNSRHASSARNATASARAATGNGEADTASPFASMNLLSDMTRQQMSLVSEATSAMLGSSELIGRIQQQAMHQASIRHQEAAETLRRTVEPMEVFTLQSNLVRQDLQEIAQYCAQLASAAFKTQLDVMGRLAEAFNGGPQNGVNSAFDAWRSAMALATRGAEAPSDLH